LVVLSIIAGTCCYTEANKDFILFEGRIPAGFQPEGFDTEYSPYLLDGKKGDLPWSEIISTDDLTPSQFDGKNFEPFQVEITDQSVYRPQPGFRRATLNPKLTADITTGITTYHFSLKRSSDKPLNLTHHYEFVFLESSAPKTVFDLRCGTEYKNETASDYIAYNADHLRLYGAILDLKVDGAELLYEVEFKPDIFHNWAVTIDWNASMISVYYSEDDDDLQLVVDKRPNPVSPDTELYIGLLKFPVGISKNPETEGYQEENIDEAIIFGGIFVEDDSDITNN